MLIQIIKRVFPIFVLAMLLLGLPEGAKAFDIAIDDDHNQQQMKLDMFYIQLLPEYNKPKYWDDDQPSLLVSYSGEFINCFDEEFYDYLYIPVPDESAMFTVSMVCETEKGMLCLPFEVIDGYVRWKPTYPVKGMQRYSFMVEYYYNPITIVNGGAKNFVFHFDGNGVVDSETYLDIYMPQFSSDYVFAPASDKHTVINHGIHVYSYEYPRVSKQEPITISIQYNKSDHQSGFVAEDAVPSVYSSLSLKYVGIMIFALILFIMGIAVITLAPKSANNKMHKENILGEHDGVLDNKEQRRRNLRRLLIDGKIDEQTYVSLLYDEQARQDK